MSSHVEFLGNATQFSDMLDAIIENAMAERDLHFTRTVNIKHNSTMCDSTKLRIIFLNILSNSIKYTPAGGSISMKLDELPCEKRARGRYRSNH